MAKPNHQDALRRPERAALSESEARRLMALLDRSDALNHACVAVEDWLGARPEARAEVLAILTPMRQEAERAFEAYGRELGLPQPGEG
jgi:hypothetical protein